MTTDYRAELERLDEKAGKIHTLADCGVAYRKSINTPELLDDRDLTLIGFIHGDTGVSEARMRQMKSAAAIADVQAPMVIKSAETKAPAMTKAALETLAEGFAKAMKPIFETYKTKIAALEAEVEALKTRPMLSWAGTYVDGQSYQEAQLVTRQGSLWVSTAPTFTTPGTPGSSWVLVVKRGNV
jgi:hypothetical protein